MKQNKEVSKDTPADVSTVKSLSTTNHHNKSTSLCVRNVVSSTKNTENYKKNEDCKLCETMWDPSYVNTDKKSDINSCKSNTSLITYNSVKFKNREIVEYTQTNVSLANNAVDNITIDKLIKSPLIRKHDIINDTVDVWAEKSIFSFNNTDVHAIQNVKYKPLIFGGTYPIDVPIGLPPKIANNSFHKEYNKTFDIDRPLCLEKL